MLARLSRGGRADLGMFFTFLIRELRAGYIAMMEKQQQQQRAWIFESPTAASL
jgi:hypothetical protein